MKSCDDFIDFHSFSIFNVFSLNFPYFLDCPSFWCFFLFSFINGAIEIKFKFESNGLEIINQYHEIFELLKYILKIQTLPPVQYVHARPNMAIFRNKTYQIYLIGSIVG